METETKRDAFAESAYGAICNLSALMQTDEVARDSKSLLKINRFKIYLSDLMASKDKETFKPGVIDFSNTPTPEDNSSY